MNGQIKVIIADDHKLLLAGLKMQISAWDEFRVVAECVNGKEAIDACEKEKPDIILIDMQMPVLTGFEATKIIKDKYPDYTQNFRVNVDKYIERAKALSEAK